MFSFLKQTAPGTASAPAGRPEPLETSRQHYVSGHALKGPYPENTQTAIFALGCYWGAERLFWQLPGVWVTAVGNMGGTTPNPTYEEVCTGRTGHAESVLVVYDRAIISCDTLLKTFFEAHDPTQGMRQGNDRGTQYRSAIFYTTPEQRAQATGARDAYQARLAAEGYGPVTTEIAEAGPFYFAESYHQQYLAKNPQGYCGLGGTGVTCPYPV